MRSNDAPEAYEYFARQASQSGELDFLVFSHGKSAESEIASGPRASHRRRNFESEALFKSLIAPTWTRFRPI